MMSVDMKVFLFLLVTVMVVNVALGKPKSKGKSRTEIMPPDDGIVRVCAEHKGGKLRIVNNGEEDCDEDDEFFLTFMQAGSKGCGCGVTEEGNDTVVISCEDGSEATILNADALQERVERLENEVFDELVILEGLVVFITSLAFEPASAVGGVESADSICQDLASGAGLNGTFMAWISDDLSSPSTRFTGDREEKYVLLDGTVIADNWNDLIAENRLVSINIDERKLQSTGGLTRGWTGTLSNGTMDAFHCLNWSSSNSGELGVVGRPSGGSLAREWTDASDFSCGGRARLYCFQQ